MSAANPAPISVEPAAITVTVAHFEIPDGSLVGAGVLPGDTAVCLLNCEVRSDDFVLVHTPEGLQVLQYHPGPGGRVKLQSLEFKNSRRYVYTRDEAVILGRAVQFACQGKPVRLLINLRPIC